MYLGVLSIKQNLLIHIIYNIKKPPAEHCLQSTTATTTLPASRVRWNRRNILNTSNLHVRPGQGSESTLCPRSRSLSFVPASGSQFNVERSDPQRLALFCNILPRKCIFEPQRHNLTYLSCQHSGVGRSLVSVGFDFHASRHS